MKRPVYPKKKLKFSIGGHKHNDVLTMYLYTGIYTSCWTYFPLILIH